MFGRKHQHFFLVLRIIVISYKLNFYMLSAKFNFHPYWISILIDQLLAQLSDILEFFGLLAIGLLRITLTICSNTRSKEIYSAELIIKYLLRHVWIQLHKKITSTLLKPIFIRNFLFFKRLHSTHLWLDTFILICQ